jgi:hypothetical protein
MIRDNLFSTCVYTLDNVLSEKENNIIKKDLLKEWKKTAHPKWQSKSDLQLRRCGQIC